MSDEELLRYAYLRGDRETLLERWPEQTERRGYLHLLDAGAEPDRELGPLEIAWILKRVHNDPELDVLLRDGPHQNANPNKVRASVTRRLEHLKLTRPQIRYVLGLFADRRGA